MSDDGRGFDPSAIARNSEDPCGGLGLVGMAERARLVGGELDVRSAPGGGHDDHAQGAGMIRVLIADDHGIVRSGLRMLIDRQLDMEVVAEADDGVAALESTQSHRPDVAVLDVSMPRMTGLQAAREIRSHVPGHARAAALDARRRALLPRRPRVGRLGLRAQARGRHRPDRRGAHGRRGRTFLSSDAQRDLMDEWVEGGRSEPDDPLTRASSRW